MYYLRIENGVFGFVVEKVHEIKSTDIAIESADYLEFLDRQSKGSEFQLKSTASGTSLFDYVEEVV